MQIDPGKLYDAALVEEVLDTPQTTLANWRYRGGGPKFLKLGRRVKYRGQDILDYIESNTFGNTAQARMAGGGAA